MGRALEGMASRRLRTQGIFRSGLAHALSVKTRLVATRCEREETTPPKSYGTDEQPTPAWTPVGSWWRWPPIRSLKMAATSGWSKSWTRSAK